MSKQPLIDQLDQAVTEILAGAAVQPESVDASLVDLLQIANDLRSAPQPGFKARLRSELERNMSMSSTARVVEFRQDFRTVTPYILSPTAEFIDFAKNVFGAEESERTNTSPTTFHAELRIGDSMVMVGVGPNRSMPAILIANVPNSDEIYERALAAGAVSLEPMLEEHGMRFGVVQDLVGNQWCISTNLGKNYMPEHRNTITTCLRPEGAAKFIEFIQSAFGARVLERYDSPEGRVAWSLLQIGSSSIGVSDPGNHGWAKPMQSMVYLYVPDADAVYDQAVRAGAQSIHAPTNQSYGDRSGGVTDAWGNQWYMATPI